MKREEVIKFFLEELKKVPNREVCQVATEDQIHRISKELDFEIMDQFLKNENLALKISEVPKEFHFEMVLYFLLMAEHKMSAIDSKVWKEDADTQKFIKNMKDILGLDKSGERRLFVSNKLCFTNLEWFLDYIEELNF